MPAAIQRVFFDSRSYIIFFVGSACVFVVIRALPHLVLFQQFFALPDITVMRRLEVFYEYAILSIHSATTYDQIISFALPLVFAFNIVVMRAYYRAHSAIFRGKGLGASATGLFLGLFGIGCFACSGLLLAPLLTFIGLGGAVAVLPYRGMEIGALGIIIMLVTSFFMMRKLASAQTCNIS